MSWSTRRYIRESINDQFKKGYTEDQYRASELRKSFFKRYIINFDPSNYKSTVERDWAYIAKREYTYDVELRSSAYGFIIGNIAMCTRIFMTKKMVWWPLLTLWPAGYYYYKPVFLQKFNKKLFDMCNVGEQYYLGRERNKVLRECNLILDREDF